MLKSEKEFLVIMLIKIIAKADFPSSIKNNNNNDNNCSLNPYYILRKLITLSSLKIHSTPTIMKGNLHTDP